MGWPQWGGGVRAICPELAVRGPFIRQSRALMAAELARASYSFHFWEHLFAFRPLSRNFNPQSCGFAEAGRACRYGLDKVFPKVERTSWGLARRACPGPALHV